MTDKHLDILQRYWGYDDFRSVQRSIIESISEGRDTLGLMPTGGGKSITFQVPALAQRGTCIVVTPLIALMEDQVNNLRMRGIKATAIHSGMTRDEIVRQLDNVTLGEYALLYASPERLQTELFQNKLRHMRVSFITIDEAHCISQWGYDFRPSYLQIAELRKILPQAPILALTATATPAVAKDIQKQLGFKEENVVGMSFERTNLTYIVRHTVDKLYEMVHILNHVPGCAIIYTRNRRQTHEIAKHLCQKGITATNYHAHLSQGEKNRRQQAWLNDEYRVMVATNAFGMGIDKADVRLVIHAETPDSPEAYFQEAGRAGRDGKRAWAVLLYEGRDCQKLLRRIEETYPPKDYIYKVYDHMCYYLQMAVGDGQDVTREFNLQDFCYKYHHFPTVADNALQLLNNAGYIIYRPDDQLTSRLMFIVQRDELYRLHTLGEHQEQLILILLRKYTGLFSDYAYIDEGMLERESGLSVQVVYTTLVSLSKQGILSYIPGKRTTLITFSQRRVDHDELRLPAHVYADRKKCYEERIHAMIRYVTDPDTCHSRFLLNYFGEKDADNCGRCDVCQAPRLSEGEEEAIRQHFLAQLAQGPLAPNTLDTGGHLRELYARVVDQMVADEEVEITEDQMFRLHT
ncbi:MAG: RecQ family ATP-dependent DNA helicase [Bacteroidaceae bacterium]|nr:RecQ family ATP-dependent DNA helicase [Bacteroidaceae bacterium]